MKGKKRCRNHGGASTGPKTDEGKMRAAANATQHGAYAQLGPYERMLAQHDPALFAAIPTETSLERELRFARMKLAQLVEQGKGGSVIAELLAQVRLLAAAQNEIRPGGDATGKFEITFRVVGEDAPPAPEDDAQPPEEPCS